uniref:alpha-amylase n=1 Tax=Saccoglossus kowalevskii TaxID=10224 RepID=A0ABM0M990_SACKO|nr:PREDICTED: alpha-amylase 1-like [Saccoglossus kowalevskii]
MWAAGVAVQECRERWGASQRCRGFCNWRYMVLRTGSVEMPGAGVTVQECQKKMLGAGVGDRILTDRFAHTDKSPDEECQELYEYCGGTFKGIENNLDYITGLGANAIWISPFIENTELGFHGYWPKNIYETNPHFGSKQDLKDLIAACQSRDVWVMADLVLNHMGYPDGCHWSGCPIDNANNFTGFVPFNDEADYHTYCDIDWSNEQQENVEICRLAYLPDLNQTVASVRETLLNWVREFNAEYGFDGYRLDFVKGVSKDFLAEVDEASDSFTLGEAYDGRTDYVASYQGYLDSLLSFPMYFTLEDVFQTFPLGKLTQIHDQLLREADEYQDTSVLGGFLDNHDRKRFLANNGNLATLRSALAYLLMAKWIPIIYYGTEVGFDGGNDPQNRESLWPHYNTSHELYQFIADVNTFSRSLGQNFIDSDQTETTYDDEFYSFTRLDTLVALSNKGSQTVVERTVTGHGFSNGDVLTNLLDHSDQVTVENDEVRVTLSNGEPKIYYNGELSGAQMSKSLRMIVYMTSLCLTSFIL